jgi:hypothetical protein
MKKNFGKTAPFIFLALAWLAVYTIDAAFHWPPMCDAAFDSLFSVWAFSQQFVTLLLVCFTIAAFCELVGGLGFIVGIVGILLFGNLSQRLIDAVETGIAARTTRVATAAMSAQMPEFMRTKDMPVPANVVRTIKGKVLMLSPDGTVSPLFCRLPEYLRAHNPTEVDVVIWISEPYKRVSGQYQSGSKATRRFCDLVFIDNRKHVAIGQAQVGGSPPPEVVLWGSGGSGLRPEREVLKFIKQLESAISQ